MCSMQTTSNQRNSKRLMHVVSLSTSYLGGMSENRLINDYVGLPVVRLKRTIYAPTPFRTLNHPTYRHSSSILQRFESSQDS